MEVLGSTIITRAKWTSPSECTYLGTTRSNTAKDSEIIALRIQLYVLSVEYNSFTGSYLGIYPRLYVVNDSFENREKRAARPSLKILLL